MKTKPLDEKTFRLIKGVWKDPKDNTILADYAKWLDIYLDDKLEFARFLDYENNLKIYFRVWGGKITITLWTIQ